MKKIVISIMKDETPYILEWVNHYNDLGFDAIVIYDNESKIQVEETIKNLPDYIKNKIIIHKMDIPAD